MEYRTEEQKRYQKHRDSESFLLLGTVMSLLAIIVLLATIPQESGPARVINFCSGLVLLGIGGGMAWWGWVLRRRNRLG